MSDDDTKPDWADDDSTQMGAMQGKVLTDTETGKLLTDVATLVNQGIVDADLDEQVKPVDFNQVAGVLAALQCLIEEDHNGGVAIQMGDDTIFLLLSIPENGS